MFDEQKQEYINSFIQDVEIERENSGEGLRKSFVKCFYNSIPDSEESGEINTLYLDSRIKNRPVGVDGYFYDDEFQTLYLVISDFHEFEQVVGLNKKIAQDKFRLLRNFVTYASSGELQNRFDGILDFSSPEYDLAEIVRTNAISRFRFILFTDQKVSERFTSLDKADILGVPVDEQVWDFNRLWAMIESNRPNEPINIDFEDANVYLTKTSDGEGFSAYLGVMSADFLADIYQRHGARLLEGNVRSYLTLRSKVNKSINRTIANEPQKFFIYNNGIAVTVRDLHLDGNRKMLNATDFQIINGGQTTATLSRAKYIDKRDLSQVFVSMKLTEIKPSLSEESAQSLIRAISKSSNNQNKITEADLSSNHPFHVNIEKQSMRVCTERINGLQFGTYWFYERSRGKYEQQQMFMSKGEKNNFQTSHPKSQVFKKEDISRVHLCWEQKPHIVAKGANFMFVNFMKQFDEEDNYEKLVAAGKFGDDYFRQTIAMLIIWKTLEVSIKKQPWYQTGGYRVNIIQYTVAIFSKLFSSMNKNGGFNWDLIWRQQALPSHFLQSLLKIAEIVQNQVLLNENRDRSNVSEWAKTPLCWKLCQEVFEDAKYAIDEDTINEIFLSNAQVRANKAQAKAEAKIDESADWQTRAFEYGHWNEACNFSTKELTPKQANSLRKVASIASTYRFPPDSVIKVAFEALEVLREEGFKF